MPLATEFSTILVAAQVNADWAWGEIYRAYSPAVLRYLRGRGALEPEDLLGEVFVQVVRGIGGFEGDEPAFRTWVFMIAHNRIVDEWRKSGRNRVDLDPAALVAGAGTGDSEAEATRRLSDREVTDILNRLSRGQRDVLYLRIFGQLTIDEIAQVVQKRPGAVKALQSRGLAAIRKEMLGKAVTL